MILQKTSILVGLRDKRWPMTWQASGMRTNDLLVAVGCRWLPTNDRRNIISAIEREGERVWGRQHVKPFPGKVLRPWQRLNGCCLNNSKTWLCLHASRPPNCFDLYGHPDGMQCIKCAYTAAAVAFCTWHWLSLFALFITFLKAETIGKSFSRTFVRAGEWQSCYVD